MDSTELLYKLLSNSRVKCSDLTSVQEKLAKIQNDGPNELLILSDFDYTATKAFDENGRRCWPTLGVFEILLNQMEGGLSEELKNVFTRYTPIELDPNLCDEEKTPHMIECWTQLHNIILSSGFDRIERWIQGMGSILVKSKHSNLPFFDKLWKCYRDSSKYIDYC
ncbi:unnamed protein product, partial [Mesorhabditis belari]|uniref:5'-nucleotidase n=1 Tax=Mesorhabditis belari TaxID=2138241 RepID=A0AAF3EPU7_9BILA